MRIGAGEDLPELGVHTGREARDRRDRGVVLRRRRRRVPEGLAGLAGLEELRRVRRGLGQQPSTAAALRHWVDTAPQPTERGGASAGEGTETLK